MITNIPMLTIMMNLPQIKLFDRRHIDDGITVVCHDSRAANNHFPLHHTHIQGVEVTIVSVLQVTALAMLYIGR